MASSALRANQVYQNAKLEQQFKKSMKELEKEQEQMLQQQQAQDQNAIGQ